MEIATTLFASVFGSGTAAAGATTAATAAAGALANPLAAAPIASGVAAGSGIAGSTIASILQGSATALSVMGMMSAANQESTALKLAAEDAKREKSLEMLQGIERRSSIRRSLMDAVGAENTAYAASGVDLTFGTPSQARSDAFRDADLGMATAVGTEQVRTSRLDERAAALRSRAAGARRAGLLSAGGQAIGGVASILDRR